MPHVPQRPDRAEIEFEQMIDDVNRRTAQNEGVFELVTDAQKYSAEIQKIIAKASQTSNDHVHVISAQVDVSSGRMTKFYSSTPEETMIGGSIPVELYCAFHITDSGTLLGRVEIGASSYTYFLNRHTSAVTPLTNVIRLMNVSNQEKWTSLGHGALWNEYASDVAGISASTVPTKRE